MFWFTEAWGSRISQPLGDVRGEFLAAFPILGRKLGGTRTKIPAVCFLLYWSLETPEIVTKKTILLGLPTIYNIYEERERPAVPVGSCGALTIRIIALELGHHFVSPPTHAVAVAEIVPLYRHFVHSKAPRGVIDL